MAKNTIQVADKPTLDTIKAEIEEMKTTLATVTEILSGGGEVKSPHYEQVKSADETNSFSFEGKGKVYLCYTGSYFKNLVIDGVEINRDIFLTHSTSSYYYYVVPFNKSISFNAYLMNYSYSGSKYMYLGVVYE